ncbi:MAG: TM2 domain-containing protein [Cytophaga sp.]|uniref:TM2 domain-containing protein n=1 Tax=Cytophaga sp. TaxID=29535 RepID=UPI003F7CEFD8
MFKKIISLPYYLKNPAVQPRTRMYVICLLLGFAGGHRFMMGYKTWILQFITLGGLGFWSLYDLVKIALNEMTMADGRSLS